MRAATAANRVVDFNRRYFNPRCPCGQRLHCTDPYPLWRKFQSTLPMRAATGVTGDNTLEGNISIHAAHAGSDSSAKKLSLLLPIFQSTLPMRAATSSRPACTEMGRISIHAAHAGSDRLILSFIFCTTLFQSTLPMRAATISGNFERLGQFISIHAAHAGSDRAGNIRFTSNQRSSYAERRFYQNGRGAG